MISKICNYYVSKLSDLAEEKHCHLQASTIALNKARLELALKAKWLGAPEAVFIAFHVCIGLCPL